MPVAETSTRIAVLATYKQFQRDLPRYGTEASWVAFAIKSFESMPPRHQGTAILASRTIAILQGWNVTPDEIAAQQTMALKAGANGYVVAYDKLDQSWSPKVARWNASSRNDQ